MFKSWLPFNEFIRRCALYPRVFKGARVRVFVLSHRIGFIVVVNPRKP